jgi:hypothetical protein
VELWAESDSIASALSDITSRWDVPLMVFRGYGSEGYLYTLGEEIRQHRRPVTIFYIGDHDPSGVDIQRAALQRVREFAPDAQITLERIAVTPAQIVEMGLPTRPAKRQDPRSKRFTGGTVETEAIPARTLRTLVDTAIQRHINPAQLAVQQAAENSERQILWDLANRHSGRRALEAEAEAQALRVYFGTEPVPGTEEDADADAEEPQQPPDEDMEY